MIKKFSPFLALIVLMSAAALTLWAQAGAEAPNQKSDREALVAELVAMPKAERIAFLKNMSPEERNGLWFLVQKAITDNNGSAVQNYQEIEPMSIETTEQLGPPVFGTITYDSGFPTMGFGGGALVGNRFNTHHNDGNTNPVAMSGTVSTIQALVVPGPANTTSSAGFVLLGPQTGGGGAMALFSTFGVATGVVDSISFAGLGVTYTGSEFFVLFGDFASVYIPAFGTGTTNSQGHHGVVGYTGGMGPNITGTFNLGGTLNSFVRATGNIVPVELMSFEVE